MFEFKHPISTIEEPLKFFQWFFLENKFWIYRDSFLYHYGDYFEATINKDMVSYTTMDEKGNDTITTVDFKKDLNQRLNREFNLFASNLEQALNRMMINGVAPEPFLGRLYDKAINISNSETIKQNPIIEDYPFVENILTQVIDAIKKEQYPLVQQKTTEKENSENPLIIELFGFLKEKYISTLEWEYFKSYLNTFLIEYKVPYIEKSFPLLKKHRPMIKWLFYCLYSKVQNSRDFQDKFSELYLKIFETTEPTDKEIKNISAKLSTKPKKLPSDFPYIEGMK
jgi:hypothetical protein